VLVAESAHLGDLIRIIIGHNLMIVSPPFLLTMHPQQSLSLRQARLYLLWPAHPKTYQNNISVLVMKMSKNPEFAKYASDLARHQDSIRSANEDLIKLSQRFGRMMPKLQKLDSSAVLSWFNLYNNVKDMASKSDSEVSSLMNNSLVTTNTVLQSQISYYYAQRQRLYSKMEIMDDVLNGMIEELLENGSFEETQKQEMRVALDGTMEKSRHHAEPAQVSA